jgi:hypothetical protein|tara:strand:- start:433 stop:645 length:213 start_codon:yes stop_codon:yes gene_type:complete
MEENNLYKLVEMAPYIFTIITLFVVIWNSFAFWILRAITQNQKIQCRNQVEIAWLLEELIELLEKKKKKS